MRLRKPQPIQYGDLLRSALLEDLGSAGDLTSNAIVPAEAYARAHFVARGSGRIAGIDLAIETLRLLDTDLEAEIRIGDGEDADGGAILASVLGRAGALLSGERVALNVLGQLSGIATATRQIVAAVAHTSARIVCTRKTTPGWRTLEKYAVRAGGGSNHRFGLYDAILIKDNHLAIAGGLSEAVERARAAAGHLTRIEVEVSTLEQLNEALELGIEAVMLDNMTLEELRRAVEITAGRAVLEASGGITVDSAASIAETGVDLLSAGFLTHSAAALDVALDVAPPSSPA